MSLPTRPQQYIGDIVMANKPLRQPQPYARFYRPAAAPAFKKPDLSSRTLEAAKQILAPKQDIQQSLPAPTPLALLAVQNARPLPHQERKNFAAPHKVSKKKRIGKNTRLTANVLIAVAVVMSGIMGSMMYKYHLALQKVEAQPLESSESAEAPQAAAAGPAAATTAGLGEVKAPVTGGGGGKLPAATPYKLSIPKLKVSASITGVTTTKTGAIGVPGNIWQVGWYKSSATPADNSGVVVLNGHVHGPTQPGIFANLTKLTNGDLVTVSDAGGNTYNYKVVSKQTIKAGEAGDEVLQSGSATKQGLNLVTCTGKIVEDKYQDRLVVYTERV